MLLAMLFLLGFAAPAHGATITCPEGCAYLQSWVDESLVPTPDESVEVRFTANTECPPMSMACAMPEKHIILLADPREGREIFYHELGHIFDYEKLNPELRFKFLRIIHHTRYLWGDEETEYDYAGEEWFADVYSKCSQFRVFDPTWGYSVDSGLVSGKLMRRACAYIRELP